MWYILSSLQMLVLSFNNEQGIYIIPVTIACSSITPEHGQFVTRLTTQLPHALSQFSRLSSSSL